MHSEIMFLSATEIRSEVESGRLVIDPFSPDLLKPASYVLRVSDRWRLWKKTGASIDPWSSQSAEDHLESVTQQPTFDIPPLGFVHASTIERVSLPDDLAGILSTLSHLARFGLSAHLNPFLVSPALGKHV